MKKDSKEEDRPLSDNEAEHKEESDNYNIPKSPEYGHFKRTDTVELNLRRIFRPMSEPRR